jgi:hypothetical protein
MDTSPIECIECGFYFHPTDEDLPPGTPRGKSHSAAVFSGCSNWRTAFARKYIFSLEYLFRLGNESESSWRVFSALRQ